ncbi:phosphotransferase family protein [Chloroflexota bacterium]
MLDKAHLLQNKYVKKIIEDYLDKKVLKVERFSTGLSHFVFDVVTEDEFTCVVRMTTPERKDELEAGLYWQQKLEKVGVFLPTVYRVGQVENYPFAVYERLPGIDLEEIYPTLSTKAKENIAHSVAKIQQKVHQLGPHHFANSPQWSEVLRIILRRSEREILKTGLFDKRYVDCVRTEICKYEDYLMGVRPVAFLYDLNIRNVIVHNEEISGIIDIDEVWYGDPLLTIGRGKTILLAMRQDTDYIDYWCQYLDLSEFQVKMVDLYALLYCVRFMGTLGQELNGNPSLQTDINSAQHLETITIEQLRVLGSSEI